MQDNTKERAWTSPSASVVDFWRSRNDFHSALWRSERRRRVFWLRVSMGQVAVIIALVGSLWLR
jgi:hypothetical protein